jgi:hypothetical protein
MPGDNAKPRATAPPELDWQDELDSAMTDIDTRLTHPRRRATDSGRQAVLPELGALQVTPEILDEIAWRVAEQIRSHGGTVAPGALTQALTQSPAPNSPPRPPIRREPEEPRLAPGKMLLIRYVMPSLPWPFRLLQRRHRKKQHPLTTARVRV